MRRVHSTPMVLPLLILVLAFVLLGPLGAARRPLAALTNAQACPDAYEPNDLFEQAKLLANDTTYAAAICSSTDMDYYAFDVPATAHLHAYLTGLPADYDLFLYDASALLLGGSANSGTADEQVDYDAAKGGRFLLLVMGKKGAYDPNNTYHFGINVVLSATDTPTPTLTSSPTRTATRTPTPTATITPVPGCPDPYEPNGSFAGAWPIGPGDWYSYLCERIDEDYFRFDVQLHDTVDIWLKELPGDYYMLALNPVQGIEGRSDQPGTADEHIKIEDAKMAGEYRVLVASTADYSLTKPYLLQVNITHNATATPTPSPTLPSCPTDPSEPNDTFAAAHTITPGGWTQGLICPPGDRDFFRFPVAAGQIIRLELRSLPADYDLFLWSPAGVEVEHSWHAGTIDELITYLAPVGGEYRAEVRPVYGQWSGTDPYDLRPDVLTLTPTPTVTRTATRTATPTVTATPTIWPGLDLTVRYVEVNQAVQTDPPLFDPVWFKPTVIRVYISTGLPAGSPCVPHVTVRLDIFDSNGGLLLRSLFPYNPGGEICAPVDPDWRELDQALNFDFPADMLQGSYMLVPWVNYDRSVPELNYDNNRVVGQPISFRPIARRLSIAYVPVNYHPAGYTGPTLPSDRVRSAASYLKATWPFRPDYVSYYRAPIPPIDWTGNVNTDDNDVSLLERITTLWEEMSPQPDHLYGWLPGGVFGGNGLGWLGESYDDPAHTAFGNDTYVSPAESRYRRTMAHELEHNVGFDHPWCTTLNGRGFDVLGRQVKSDDLLAVMCAGQPEYRAWADRATYGSMYNALDSGLWSTGNTGANRSIQLAAPAHYVIVSGRVCSRQGTATGALSPLQHVMRSEASRPPAGSAYCLEFRGSAGALLQTICFDLSVSRDAGGVPDCLPFAYTLPWPEGTARVVLRQGQTVLDEVQASAHPPAVHLLSPNGGEAWDGEQTVTWTASDSDQDALTFALLYSRDGGTSWLPLTTGLTGTSYSLDTAYLAGGEGCRIKVRVSDGFYSAEDASDGAFSMPRRPPEAAIESPVEGATYRPSELLTLLGQADDPEDGPLAAVRLTWWLWTPTSSQYLGSGTLLSAGPLPAGDHTIVLNAEDADGNVAVAWCHFHVGETAANTLHLPLLLKR